MITLSNFNSRAELLDYFKDEDTCKHFFEKVRWPNRISCPHCAYPKVWRTNRGFRCCNPDCDKKFSVISGTIFEHTRIKMRKWFEAIYVLTSNKKGMSSVQLGKDLGVTQKTAWFLAHRIRKMIDERFPDSAPKLSETVFCDETYIGGKRRNMHGRRREEIRKTYGNTGYAEKLPVFGMLQKDGRLIMMSVSKTDGNTLQPIIKHHINPGTTLITDTHGAYTGLNKHFNHFTVNHKKGNYVSPDGHHTNSIESAWVSLKRGYVGIYHYMSLKHLDRYCAEYTYRFNTRSLTDMQRFKHSFFNTSRRLKYKDLICP